MIKADLRARSSAELATMVEAGAHIRECYRLLRKTGANVVGEALRGVDTYYEWEHYPQGDVYDPETHSQYYYHSHAADDRLDEHGHFHTFLRPKGMPEGIKPARLPDVALPQGDNDALSHLVAISMSEHGYPVRLFTTNRWVTGEVWYDGDDVCRMLDRFHMDMAYPSLPLNIWISAMLRLFRPQIEMILGERDSAMAAWQEGHPDANAYEDRDFEIASAIDVSVDDQIAAAEAVLRDR